MNKNITQCIVNVVADATNDTDSTKVAYNIFCDLLYHGDLLSLSEENIMYIKGLIENRIFHRVKNIQDYHAEEITPYIDTLEVVDIKLRDKRGEI